MKTIAKNIIMFTAVVTALPTAMLAFSLLMLLWVPTVQLARLLERLTHKVMDAIKAVGNAGGYVYIMETNAIPFINTTLSTDVTAQVKAKLGIK